MLKYGYSMLMDVKNAGENYHFYGIIYDATYPNQDENSINYIVTLKVIDDTINYKTNPTNFNDSVINVIIKSSKKENLPFINSIGDIIRVHRGYFKPKNRKNIYINLTATTKIQSAWCLYRGASNKDTKNFDPIGCSSNNFTFEKHDCQIISKLRNWIRSYFKDPNSLFFDKEVKLNTRNEQKEDFDVLVQISDKKILDNKIVFKIKDETDTAELNTEKTFRFLEKGDVVRIRGINHGCGKGPLTLNAYSNAMKLFPSMNLYQQFNTRIGGTAEIELTWSNIINQQIKKENTIENEITKLFHRKFVVTPKKGQPEYPLLNFDSFKPGKNGSFRMELQVIDILPDSEFTKTKKGKTFYHFELTCREEYNNNNTIKIYVSSQDDEGSDFAGDTADNIDQKKFNSFKNNLLKFRNYINVNLEEIKLTTGGYFYRVLGKYDYHN